MIRIQRDMSRVATALLALSVLQFSAACAMAAYADLVISEIMYHPADPTNGSPYLEEDFEFIEVMNTGTATINLRDCGFTKGINFVFPSYGLGTGASVVVVSDLAAFSSRYNTNGMRIAGAWTNGNKLSNNGEDVVFEDPVGTVIESIVYTNTWYPMSDGEGFSLVPVNPYSAGNPNLASYWRWSASLGGSPGARDPVPYSAPIQISEVLAHTDFPDIDAVEFYNPTGTNVDIGNWWLTDNPTNAMTYRIPPGSIVPAYGYFVIYGDNDWDPFNNASLPPQYFGSAFLLSELGESAIIYSPDMRYTNGFIFGASLNGQSFGRYVISDGIVHYPPQISTTLGTTNAGPLMPTVVISEILYSPLRDDHQFIELLNASGGTAWLYNTAYWIPWHVEDIGYEFPLFVTMEPGERLILVRNTISPEDFRHLRNIDSNVKIYNFIGSLSVGTGNLSLRSPESPHVDVTPYYITDEVAYRTNAPWPNPATNTGRSLCRKSPYVYGCEPTNWFFSTYGGSPGAATPTDADNDGMDDAWEVANGLSATNPADALADSDGDGLTNYMENVWGCSPTNSDTDGDGQSDSGELVAGTVPTDPASSFGLSNYWCTGSGVIASWQGLTGRVYRLESTAGLVPGTWTNLPAFTNIQGYRGVMEWTNQSPADADFFRIRVRRGL